MIWPWDHSDSGREKEAAVREREEAKRKRAAAERLTDALNADKMRNGYAEMVMRAMGTRR